MREEKREIGLNNSRAEFTLNIKKKIKLKEKKIHEYGTLLIEYTVHLNACSISGGS